jgi:hypothetical protein
MAKALSVWLPNKNLKSVTTKTTTATDRLMKTGRKKGSCVSPEAAPARKQGCFFASWTKAVWNVPQKLRTNPPLKCVTASTTTVMVRWMKTYVDLALRLAEKVTKSVRKAPGPVVRVAAAAAPAPPKCATTKTTIVTVMSTTRRARTRGTLFSVLARQLVALATKLAFGGSGKRAQPPSPRRKNATAKTTTVTDKLTETNDRVRPRAVAAPRPAQAENGVPAPALNPLLKFAMAKTITAMGRSTKTSWPPAKLLVAKEKKLASKASGNSATRHSPKRKSATDWTMTATEPLMTTSLLVLARVLVVKEQPPVPTESTQVVPVVLNRHPKCVTTRTTIATEKWMVYSDTVEPHVVKVLKCARPEHGGVVWLPIPKRKSVTDKTTTATVSLMKTQLVHKASHVS